MLRNMFLLLAFCGCTAAVGKDLTNCHVDTKLSSGNVSCIAKKATGCTSVNSVGLSLLSITSLRVTSEALENYSSGLYLYSLARISWSLPSHIEQNDEFSVQLQTSNNTQSLCYLITLHWASRSKAISSSEEALVEFSLPLEPNCYSIAVKRVTNLPPPTRNPHLIPHSAINVKERVNAYMNIPALWVTDLILSNDSCNCLISVTFELAPTAYNFTTYIVILQAITSTRNTGFVNRTTLDVTGNQRQGAVYFTDVKPGQYKILVFPNDTDKNKRSCRCQCRNAKIEACRNRKICPEFGCLTTDSHIVSIDKVNPEECVVVYEDPYVWDKVAGIVAGLVTSFAVIIIVIWYLRRPRHIVIDLHDLPEQPVFLLFTNDHEYHQKVIHYLIEALQRLGNIRVKTMYDNQPAVAQNPLDFIEEKCTESDKILIINSDVMARYFLTTDDETIPLDPLDSQVSPFLSYLRRHRLYQCTTSKLVMAQFDYTKRNDIAREVHYHEREHMLTRDFESLLLHLHDLEKRSGRTVYHVANVQNTSDIPELEKLNSAILMMRNVTANEPLERTSLRANPSMNDSQNEDEHSTSDSTEFEEELNSTVPLMGNIAENDSNPSVQGSIQKEDEGSDCESDQMDESFSFAFHPPSSDELSITSEEQAERLACFYTTVA